MIDSLDIVLLSVLLILFVFFYKNRFSLPCTMCKSVFNTAPVALITLDKEHRIIEWNDTAKDIFGWSFREAYLRPFADFLLTSDQTPELHEALDKARLKGKSRSKHTITTKNSETLVCEWHHAWIASDKKPPRIVCAAYDVSDTQELLEDLTFRAEHDPLTGLYNRDAMQMHLAKALERSKRSNTKTVLFFIDLDDFKIINDTYGHEVGDQLLFVLASHLLEGLRESDCICRYGGDEFVVITEGMNSISDLNKISQTIQNILNQTVCLGNTLSIQSHASIGYAVFPDEATNADDLFRIADQSMYLNKQSRNQRYTNHIECPHLIEE